MAMKGGPKSSSSHAEDLVGTFFGSFLLVIAMIFACAACRRKREKDRTTRHGRTVESTNEYQIPGVHIEHAGSSGDANAYSIPEPNIVYTDLDMLALQSAANKNRKPVDPPTQYAIIDEEKLNEARRKRQERLYENVNITNDTKPAIYDNVNEINI